MTYMLFYSNGMKCNSCALDISGVCVSRLSHSTESSLNTGIKVHGANMEHTWVLSATGGSHVSSMDLAIWVACINDQANVNQQSKYRNIT